MLNPNQLEAINISVKNDFQSGIHFHATGTGKSWIAFHILMEYHKLYSKHHILWICEKKDILLQQFNSKNLINNGFSSLSKSFHIINYAKYKCKDWHQNVNSSIVWQKPILLVVNRCYLTQNERYKKIKVPFRLIIHDECHTIQNKSTKNFYNYYLNKYSETKCIGFSATPNTNFKPFTEILTSYSIYNAVKDKVIIPPKIVWFKSSITEKNSIHIINNLLQNMPYQKIIIWTGMIHNCFEIATKWHKYFPNWLFCIDTSSDSPHNFGSYQEFKESKGQSILFCAGKHREGSDIPFLDTCIFLDMVTNRGTQVFTQCIGRVLRKDPHSRKKYGLIIDIYSKSALNITNKLNQYLNLPTNVFPWKYSQYSYLKTNVNILLFDIKHKNLIQGQLDANYINNYGIDEIKNKFIRKIPKGNIYTERIKKELHLIIEKNLTFHLFQSLEILSLAGKIPHVTRGSCGSSLVCYLLGISNVDPVKYNIKFARFLNQYRDNLPDIDFDFPHHLRDEIFFKLQQKYPNKIARISNHIYYHPKSAKREALRKLGIRKFIAKNDIQKTINKLSSEKKDRFDLYVKQLTNSFRGYSLHCGGIIYYPEGIPEKYTLKKNISTLDQVILNKKDIAKQQNFKIDILSSRALSQLNEMDKSINFDAHLKDNKTIEMLARGDNIGLTLAESPLMRKSILRIKPDDIEKLAICLSVIRPVAKEARYISEIEQLRSELIFDDDAINIICQELNCCEEKADYYRRKLAKKEKIDEINDLSEEGIKKLKSIGKYGFCRAHAFSYAQLVWQLAYWKANFPKLFWTATLKHSSSFYRPWVHKFEAICHGVMMEKGHKSIYGKNRISKLTSDDPLQQLKKLGYWNMTMNEFFPGCYLYSNNNIYHFKGLIASSRTLRNGITIIFLGVDKQKYIEISAKNINTDKKVGYIGKGRMNEGIIECTEISSL